MTDGFVLDTGALIALESVQRQREIRALLRRLGPDGAVIVSAGSIAEVWRGSPRQAHLAKLLSRRSTSVIELTLSTAKAIGIFLGRCAKADDIVDAHVVMLALSHRLPVITSDPKDLLALDPELRVMAI